MSIARYQAKKKINGCSSIRDDLDNSSFVSTTNNFESDDKEDLFNYNLLFIILSKKFFIIIAYIGILLLLGPWIYLLFFKYKVLNNLGQFIESTFSMSCGTTPCFCPCNKTIETFTNATTANKPL